MEAYLNLSYASERLIVRPLTLNDYDAFLKGFQESLPSKNRFDDGAFDISYMTREWYAALLERRSREAAADHSYVFHIFRKEKFSI